MGAKVHRSLRIESDLAERIERLRKDNETITHAMSRVMAVGCDTLEGIAQETRLETASERLKHNATTEKLITMLEDDKKRLIAEVDGYKEIVAEKDKQIAAALAKAHDLTEQAHVLTGAAQVTGKLPSADDGGEIVDVTPPVKIGFWEWWKNYR